MEQLLKAHLDQKVSIKVNQEQQQKKTLFLGSFKPHAGLKVWELNVLTLKISDVTPETKDVTLSGAGKKKIHVKEGHYYCVALNEKNAERKFVRMLNAAAAKKGVPARFTIL